MYIQFVSGRPIGLLLLFVCLCLRLEVQAQSGFENRIVIDVDDPAVTATVDNPQAVAGDLLTLTLSGLTPDQTAAVSAGSQAGGNECEVTQVNGNTFTLEMPSGILYINVEITGKGQVIRVQTPGISSGLAEVTLTVGGRPIEQGKTSVKVGEEVTATLQLENNSKYTLALERITGRSIDGSWVLLSVGDAKPSAADPVTFKMPASDVILSYTISSEVIISKEPTEDDPDGPHVDVPEIAWPDNPNPPEEPVLVITKEIEEAPLERLFEELQQSSVMEEGAITELVDISLQLANGERVQPGSPVTVTYPYPQGTDGRWNFRIVHLISDAGDIAQAAFETIYPQSLYIGLRFTVSSFSPFAIIYTPPVTTSPTEEPVRVTALQLSETTLSLDVDDSHSLTATLTPTDATDQRVEWLSDKEAVVTVSSDGTLQALAPGTAVVTARSVNGGFTATCQVTVKEVEEPDPGPEPDDPDPDVPDVPDDPDDPTPPVSNAQLADATPLITVSEGNLRVESAMPVAVQVFGLSGRMQAEKASACSHLIPLPSGLWLVRVGTMKAVKIILP